MENTYTIEGLESTQSSKQPNKLNKLLQKQQFNNREKVSKGSLLRQNKVRSGKNIELQKDQRLIHIDMMYNMSLNYTLGTMGRW